jgi:hypothetical protein
LPESAKSPVNETDAPITSGALEPLSVAEPAEAQPATNSAAAIPAVHGNHNR